MPHARLLVVTPSLGGGGAERHMLRILPVLQQSLDVEVATLRSGGELAREVPADVPVHEIGSLGWIPAARRLRSLLRRRTPALALGFQEAANIPLLLALRALPHGTRPRTAVSTQSAPSVVLADAKPRTRWRISTAIRRLYPLADRLVVAADGVGSDLIALVPPVADRIRRIYNAGIDATVVRRAAEPCEHPFFGSGDPVLVACGRLTEQKDYPVLLAAIGRLAAERPVRAIVLGDGPLRRDLERQADALGVREAVDFAGYVTNPYPYMARASLFVLSSRSEGFGNVLAEALALGVPIVSTDCPHGPGEILDRGRYGRLVPPRDPAALAEGIAVLLDDPDQARAFAAKGPARAEAFTAERSGRAYVELLDEMLGAGDS